MNKKNLILSLLITLTLMISASPFTALANIVIEEGEAVPANVPPLVISILKAIVQTAFYIGIAVVTILWIVTGLLFLTAQGAPEKLKTARTSLFAAVAGTLLVIVAGSAIALVKQAFGIP